VDVLSKVDSRVGSIELVEDVPGFKEVGETGRGFWHKRRILAGMRQERHNPKEI
jgi:hypothetical protein